jgi:spore maturation protein CgeB
MKILFSRAFNPSFEALPDYLAAALTSLGHEVIPFNHRAFRLPARLRTASASLLDLDSRLLNAAFLRLARRLRPDLVLVNQGMTIRPGTVERARALGARCVNWFSDYPAEFDSGVEAAPAYDAFHLGSSYAAMRHQALGHPHAAWLPFACDPGVHRPEDAAAGRFPSRTPQGRGRVVLVGSHYPERQILLRFLRGLPVDVWGPGWERAASDPHVAPMLRGPALRPSQWVGLYGACAAALNIHYGAFGPADVSGDMANTRVFEILACGAPQITDRQRDVLALFREGEHLLAFSSGEELRARVEEALADPDRMRAIASAGRRAVLAAHTYVDRARVLLGEAASPALPASECRRAAAGGRP